MDNGTEVINTVNDKMDEYRKERCNIVGVGFVREKPKYLAPVVRVLEVDAGEGSTDIYKTPSGKWAFRKPVMQKFRILGGIDWDEETGRQLAAENGNVIRVVAVGKRFDIDGTIKKEKDTKTIDLRAQEDEIRLSYEKKAATDRELRGKSDEEKRAFVERNVKEFMIQLRKHAREKALTGAKNRVISALLGLKGEYSKEELRRPFVFISLVPELDMKDPDIKRMVVGSMFGAVSQMYGNGKPALPGPCLDFEEPEAFEAGTPEVESIGFETHEDAVEPVPERSQAMRDIGEFPASVRAKIA